MKMKNIVTSVALGGLLMTGMAHAATQDEIVEDLIVNNQSAADWVISANFVSDGQTQVEFLGESAGYNNSFGYFLYNEDGSADLANKVELIGNANTQPVPSFFDLGLAAGTKFGFWIEPNGDGDPVGPILSESGLGYPAGQDGFEYFVAIESDDAGYVYAFEDIPGGGDQDRNDFAFAVTGANHVNTAPFATSYLGLIGLLSGVVGLRRRKRS